MRLHLLIAALLGTLIMPYQANSGSFTNDLSLGVGEEYNSNVNENSHPKSDWLSVASAKGGISYEAARLTVNGSVDGSFNYYALGTRTSEFRGNGQVNGSLILVPDTVFLSAGDQFLQVNQNLNQGATNSTDSTKNLTNQNTITASLYVTPHVADRLQLKFGTDFSTVIYNSTEQNKQTYSVYGQAGYDLTSQLQMNLRASGSHQEPYSGGNDRIILSGGFTWQYADEGLLYFMAGPQMTFYNTGSTSLDPYWSAGLNHNFGKLQFAANTSSNYQENPATKYSTKTDTYGASLAWQQDRLGLQARASYSTLSGKAQSNSQQMSLGVSASYELLPRLTLKAGGSREASSASGSAPNRWYADGSLSYMIKDGFSVEGYYKWKLSGANPVGVNTSGANPISGSTNNYNVSIVGVRLSYAF